jgi:hypothetical protein
VVIWTVSITSTLKTSFNFPPTDLQHSLLPSLSESLAVRRFDAAKLRQEIFTPVVSFVPACGAPVGCVCPIFGDKAVDARAPNLLADRPTGNASPRGIRHRLALTVDNFCTRMTLI